MRLTTRGKHGSLHQFTQKVMNKSGEVVEYPKVRGNRDPHNPQHWKWQITWKENVDGKWQSRCRIVPHRQVRWVQKAISESLGIDAIRAFLA